MYIIAIDLLSDYEEFNLLSSLLTLAFSQYSNSTLPIRVSFEAPKQCSAPLNEICVTQNISDILKKIL